MEAAADTSADTAEPATGGGEMASGTVGVGANGAHAHPAEPAKPSGTPVSHEGGGLRLEADRTDAPHSDSRTRLSADILHANDDVRVKSGTTEGGGGDAEVRPTARTTQAVAAADETTILRRDVTDDPSQ